MGLTGKQSDSLLTRTVALVPEDASGYYAITGDGYIFTQEADRDHAWFNLSTHVPLAAAQPNVTDWKECRTIRTSAQSPFLSVSHRMYVTLSCTYDMTDGGFPERVTEHLRFHVPLKFVKIPCGSPHSSRSSTPTLVGHARASSEESGAMGCVDSLVDLPLLSAPYAASLPPYSHLYYANGDRKIDYSIPLPLYTPRADPVGINC